MKCITFKLFLFFLVIFLFPYQIYCQDSIGCLMQVSYDGNHTYSGSCTPDQNGDWETFRNINTYIPDANANLPLHNPPLSTIEVNINIIQKDDGTGNLPNNQTTIDRMNTIMGFVNSFYASFGPSDPISWVTELPNYDSKVRFSLGESGSERVYFYQNTAAWDDTYPSTTIEPYINQNYPERLKKVNIYIFGNPNNNNWAHANLPSWTDFGKNSWVVLFYWSNPGSDYAISGSLAHELGHNLELLHTYLGGNASAICDQQDEDFLQDVFLVQPPSTSNCPHTSCWSCDPFAVNGDGITNNLLGGNQHASYVSPMQAGQMHRSLAITSLRKYVFCEKSPIPLFITGTQEWDFDFKLYRDLIISANSQLTISCNLVMLSEAKIIVEPNGKLIIDGGKIGTDIFEDNPWQGIEVWGNPSLSQIPANQGWLVITNGGTIENAEVAVRAGSADYTGKGGGIVSAENAVFLNNTVSAMFDPYTAYTNTSAFGSCTFNYTKTISGEPELYFAKLNNVISVQFNNCTFTNNSSQDRIGVGIESINSIFSVEGQCTEYSGSECIEWDNGLFENLEYGVYATASTTTRFADIRHTTFTDNLRGIYLGGMTLPRVTSNEFQLNRTAAQGGYGLYLDGSTQYWVEDNHFESSIAETPTGIGIYVNASGSLANEIYLNSFDYIEYAVTVLGYNRNSRTTTTGLQIRCNNYDHTLFDETIVHEGPFLPGSDGIASIQGSNSTNVEDMAGNLFYYNTTVSGDFDDINNQSNHLYYYYSNNAGNNHVEPLDYTVNTVTKVPKSTPLWNYEGGCPSNLPTGGGGGIEGLRSAMIEAQSNIVNTETLLLALVDGGDTETLNAEVETSTPPETSEIYNELMTGSPYLSETVVGTAIDKEEVLPNSMLRDVMVANPHTSTSLQLLDKLDNRTNPMPAWMKSQILAGRSIRSLKTELEGQLASYQITKCRAMNSLTRYFGQVPENPAITDSLIALYQSDNTLSSQYMQAWLYLNSGQYQQGQNVMASIPANFTIAGDELAEYQNIQWLYTMLKGLLESGNGLDDLSGAQIAQLHTIVADETDFASVYARNMLLAIDDLEYQEPIILPNSMKSAEVEEAYHEALNSQAPTMLEVYPNPSKDFIILAYQFDKETKGMIEIRDISGKPVQSIPFDGIQDQVTLTTHGWPTGVYVLSLMVNDKVFETTKFTLVK